MTESTWSRRLARALHDRLHPPGPDAGGLLAGGWRWARRLHHAFFRRQPALMVVLDEPALLHGFAALTGWTISRNARVVWVQAIVDNQVVAQGPPVEDRPDLFERFPSFRGPGPHGFRLAPPPDLLAEGIHPLCLRVRDERGNVAEHQTRVEIRDYRRADVGGLPGDLRGFNRLYQLWLREAPPARPTLEPAGALPVISVVVPVYRPNLDHLRQCLESVIGQQYRAWELCVCDDGGNEPDLTRLLENLAAREPRFRHVRHSQNRGIAAATNTALALATGDWIAFLDQDDLLAPQALAETARTLSETNADLVYTDEDRLDEHGRRVEPLFKPDWSLDLLFSRMYLGHLCVYRRTLLDRIGPLRSEFDGAQDYDLALRAAAATVRIVHVPQVLYHWRMGGNSAAAAFNRRCHERGRRAIAERLAEIDAGPVHHRVEDGPFPCSYQVRYRLARRPLVSILIPTRGNHAMLHACLASIRRRTRYRPYEVLVLDNGGPEQEPVRLRTSQPVRVLRLPIPFNHSRLNNLAVPHARGEVLLLLNDDSVAINPDWLLALVEQAMRPEVGAVGALLYYPDGRIQHAGVALGRGAAALPINAELLRHGLDRGTVFLIREVSAVTGACLMIRRDVYLRLGGLDEAALPNSFNDVDLCLRLREAGYRIVQTPLARLYHHESASRTFADEERYIQTMWRRWGHRLREDPFWRVPPIESYLGRGPASLESPCPRSVARAAATTR